MATPEQDTPKPTVDAAAAADGATKQMRRGKNTAGTKTTRRKKRPARQRKTNVHKSIVEAINNDPTPVRQTFLKLVKRILRDDLKKTKIRLSRDLLDHLFAENTQFLINHLACALHVAARDGRCTVRPKDVRLVKDVCRTMKRTAE